MEVLMMIIVNIVMQMEKNEEMKIHCENLFPALKRWNNN